MKKEIKFGDLVKDSITGYEGVVTGFTSYLTGCDQVLVTQKWKKQDGDVKAAWFDITRVDGTDLLKERSNKGSMDPAPIK